MRKFREEATLVTLYQEPEQARNSRDRRIDLERLKMAQSAVSNVRQQFTRMEGQLKEQLSKANTVMLGN